MQLIKRFLQRSQSGQSDKYADAVQHPNFWMYQ